MLKNALKLTERSDILCVKSLITLNMSIQEITKLLENLRQKNVESTGQTQSVVRKDKLRMQLTCNQSQNNNAELINLLETFDYFGVPRNTDYFDY